MKQHNKSMERSLSTEFFENLSKRKLSFEEEMRKQSEELDNIVLEISYKVSLLRQRHLAKSYQNEYNLDHNYTIATPDKPNQLLWSSLSPESSTHILATQYPHTKAAIINQTMRKWSEDLDTYNEKFEPRVKNPVSSLYV